MEYLFQNYLVKERSYGKRKTGRRCIPACDSLLREDEYVNYPALDKLIDFLIENGATGVIPCGSTGELVSMTLEEQLEINQPHHQE